ncbi:MAG TPA: IclR family transcriptional regulator [Anaerolineaceae bacterium]
MINSLLKAIDILEVFTPEKPRQSLAEIASRLDLPKSTVHNLLRTLLSRGFIEKVDGDRYALGTAVISLTQAVRVNVELRDRAAPLLRELADFCRESVLLAILDGNYLLYVYAVESPRRLMARTAVGDRVPLHCTSIGKSILAYLPPEEVERILNAVGLPASTDATITDTAALQKDLEQVRQRGYALDCQEHEPSTYCVGAPIFGSNGKVVAACSISGADPEILGTRLPQISQRVCRAAQEISRLMGYVPPRHRLVAPRVDRKIRAQEIEALQATD